MNFDLALKQFDEWRRDGLKMVLSTGVFDILHIEHMRFLKKAKISGDKLVVGIECDTRVTKIKGSHRPVNNETVRLEQLISLKAVDLAFVMPEKFDTQEDWEKLMKQMRPDVYAVSSHTSFLKNKQEIAIKYGAAFKVVHKFNPQVSTSKIYQKIAEDL